MTTAELIEVLYQKSIRFIARRPRSEKEMREYLAKKTNRYHLADLGLSDDIIIEAIGNLLKEKNLINDEEFISWWVEQRSYFRPKGERALRAELYKKGIDRALIDEYFEENLIDEISLAIEVLKKKSRAILANPTDTQYKKAITLLIARGFSFETAKKAFEQWRDVE